MLEKGETMKRVFSSLKEYMRAFAVIAVLAVLPTLQQLFLPSANAIPVERVLFTGVADSSNATAPKWRKTNFVAQRTGSATIKVSWTGDANMRFQLQRADNTVIGGDTSTSRVSPKTYTANLVAGTSYGVAVWSFSGVATYTLSVTEDFPDTEAPSTPQNLTVTNQADSAVDLQWSASTDNDAVTGYQIYRDGQMIGTSVSNMFSDSGLAEATSYMYEVAAVDPALNVSARSNAVTATTTSSVPDTTAPSTPQNLSSPQQTATSVNLSWDASSDDRAVSGYVVYRNGQLVTTVTANSYTDTGLQADTQYAYYVVATDAAGNVSEQSDEIGVMTLSAPTERPNVVVINLDDMRSDLLQHLPKVQQWMADGGTNFPNAFVASPTCCPSRASSMSGRYVHNTTQYFQDTPGADQNLTIQRYLKDAGYYTGHSGKYLHWYSLGQRAPHWDRWNYFKGGYTDVFMRQDNTTVKTQGYSTTITFDKGIEFMRDFENRDDGTPFYLQLTPVAPHGPSTPEAKYSTASVPTLPQVPSHTEIDRTDKPNFVRYTNVTYSSGVTTHRNHVRTLYSVDDQVDRLMRELETLGELENTLVVFTSDNGYFYGEHGRSGKFLPYDEAVRVPFLMRWPAGNVPAGVVDQRIVSHVDIAATIMAAAGVTSTEAPIDGKDILSGYSRPFGYTEYYYDPANGNYITTWAAIHTPEYVYVEYYDTTTNMNRTPTFREYYDMVNDPYQMQNVLADGISSNDPDVASLSTALNLAKNCAGATCQ